jgi:hypothetical protein
LNFLQIAQKVAQKTGTPSSGLTTVVGQTGELARLVAWCSDAYDEIQTLHENWEWMRASFSFETTAGKGFYLPTSGPTESGVTNLSKWDGSTFRLYKTSIGRSDEQFLVEWDYWAWYDTYDFGLEASRQDRPQIWAERPEDKAILLASIPDDVYTVTGKYHKTPTTLSADVDTPAMPTRFHPAIVYKAMTKYGLFEGAAEVLAEGERGYGDMLRALELDQLPEIGIAEPLA